MDPNNPNFRQQFSGFSDDFLTNPEFQLFLQRMGNTSLQPPPQYQTPTQFPLRNHVNEECTPEIEHDSNTQFDESEEDNVPETPQYPPPVPELKSNQVVARATRIWSVAEDEDILRDIMKTCIIMHNMIVEDERHNYTRAEVLRAFYEEDQQESTPASTSTTPPFEFNVGRPTNFDFNAFLQRKASLRDREIHLSLKRDLVEHIWQHYGPRN
ncbi:uncharacterized protein LOC110724910 [Chenopodium quinoa]|uniref:uncharacterized protein LOC110724910 n=1 Tax=Chenopodium quinoa TaxID=63459 RepID=UPI000B78C070|nr:uncharacterized protein LOC110724910 [Chenopodium quinoa]